MSIITPCNSCAMIAADFAAVQNMNSYFTFG